VWVGVGLGVCGFSHDVKTGQVHLVQNHPIDTMGWGRVGFPTDLCPRRHWRATA
jgi:hypothetical protein